MSSNDSRGGVAKGEGEQDRFNLSSVVGKWSRCSGFEKMLIAITTFAVGLSLLLSIFLASKQSPSLINPYANESKSPLFSAFAIGSDGKVLEICEHRVCTIAAAEILLGINETANPCENFVEFACGSWVKNNPIPHDSSTWNQFSALGRHVEEMLSAIMEQESNDSSSNVISKVKAVYAGCLNETRIEQIGLQPLIDILNQYGGWPMAGISWNASQFDMHKVLGDTRSKLGASYVFSVYVRSDSKDTLKNALYIDQPSLGMPRSVFVTPQNYLERINAYKNYIKSVVQIISGFLGTSFNDGNLTEEIDALFEFETKLANLSSPDEMRRDINRMYNPMTLEELHSLTQNSTIDWLSYFREVFSSTSVEIFNSTRILLIEPEYIRGLSSLLAETESKVVSNYVLWRVITKLGDKTVKSMREALEEYERTAFGVKSPESRNVICSSLASSLMEMAVGLLYTREYFSKETKKEASAMIDDIKNSFKHLLERNQWMDRETKPLAKEKSDWMNESIGYPDWYEESGALEKYYANLSDIDPNEHFQNILTLLSWNSNDKLKKLNDPTDRTDWYSSPSDVNAYYEQDFNAIVFPAGILQPPFYRANAPRYLNYGGIGQVIGHEITHGFDDQGSQFNKNGNAIPWWSNSTIAAFKEKIECIRDQYDNYRVPELDANIPNATMNGKTTLGENIADNGGLRSAYYAYVKYREKNGLEPALPGLTKYTPQQLFFVANAQIWCSSTTKEGLLEDILSDPHSPLRFRIIGPMSNMKEFAEAWGCPLDSAMNPEKKCIVW